MQGKAVVEGEKSLPPPKMSFGMLIISSWLFTGNKTQKETLTFPLTCLKDLI